MIRSDFCTAHEAEEALVMLTAAERTRWQEVSRVLLRVEREELWRDVAPSFTAWVRGVASRSSMQPSSFWRALKAARFVLERSGTSDSDAALDGVRVGAQSIELAEKIARCAPDEMAEDIVQRTLAGELRYIDLYETWRAYRPATRGLTARGRLPNDPDRREEALIARESELEANKRRPDTKDALAAGELMMLLANTDWLGAHEQAHCEMGVEVAQTRADMLVAVRHDPQRTHEIELHGICVRGSMRQLHADPLNSALRTSMHRLWLAVPWEHVGKARDTAPAYAGVLGAKSGELHVARSAKSLRPDAAAQLPWMAALLARAHRWPLS